MTGNSSFSPKPAGRIGLIAFLLGLVIVVAQMCSVVNERNETEQIGETQ